MTQSRLIALRLAPCGLTIDEHSEAIFEGEFKACLVIDLLGQAPRTPGVQVAALVDLSLERLRQNLDRVCRLAEQHLARSIDDALKNGTTFLTDDLEAIIAHGGIEIIVECTGNPIAAVDHEARPMLHWMPQRITAHVKLWVLSLMIQRAAELRTKMAWTNIRTALDTLKAVSYRTEKQAIAQTFICGHWAHLSGICDFLFSYRFEMPTFLVATELLGVKIS